MTIRRLPEGVVNRIAAGEVVERPASAVKELVENSIDAGARRVDVVVRDGGRALISVSDDGSGMDRDELDLALERHATSKLPNDDLSRIGTLGFRGEALPAIAAVSRMTITSRRRDGDHAWALAVEGGRKGGVFPSAGSFGTRIEVRDLFFATPARLKFLKSDPTEQGHVVQILERLAMARPDVAFTLSDGVRTLVRLPAADLGTDPEGARLDRLGRIMGREFADNAVAVSAERHDHRIEGFAGLPTLHRRTNQQQFLFVNGRPVRDRLLQGAVRGAYQDLLASDRHPLVVLFLQVPLSDVDVNVHPMKTEVRFRDSALVRGLIVGGLRHALEAAGHRATTTTTARVAAFAQGPGSAGGWRQPSFPRTPIPAAGLAEEAASFQAPFLSPEGSAPSGPAEPAAGETGDEADLFPLGRARAQLHGTFIVAETATGVVIVDQHAAHERLVHERLKLAMDNGPVPRQGLLIPEVVELGQAGRILERSEELQAMGLVVEPFGGGAVLVREVPALLGVFDIKALMRDLADDLDTVGDALVLKDAFSATLARIACHGSIRAGRQLTIAEMDRLLREMEATPHAGQCSHGRPTYVELKLGDIERLFGRR
jgi:DNA mismatch repair protein MutL